jgi:hypothetical protein
MKAQNQQQQPIEILQTTTGVYVPPRLFTLKKFAERHSDFITLSALTNQVFKARPRHSSKGEIPGNGMLDFGVIVRIGRKVLINDDAYFRWLAAQQEPKEILDHSQNICDPDGTKIHIGLEGSSVSVTDKEDNIVKFSAYLVPEVRATLLDIESAFSRELSHE